MLKSQIMASSNYIKIAWRNLKKNKGFTAINIIGLAIGMAAAMLIFIWVRSELTHDRMYPKTDQIYTVGNKDYWGDKLEVWFSTPKPLAAALKADYPEEVNHVTRINTAAGFLFAVGDKKINSFSGLFVDTSFFNMFDLKVLAGDPVQAIHQPTAIVVTENFAKNLFAHTDVIGKTVKIDSVDYFTIAAVLANPPSNSFMTKTSYFLPWKYMEKIGYDDQNWGNNSITTMVEFKAGTNVNSLRNSFKGLTQRHHEATRENLLQPLKDAWLYNKYVDGKARGGRIEIVRIFTVIAAFILLIACINFMNLSTAQSERRAKEVAVRKVVGAKRGSLIFQFLTESILIALFAGIIAVIIVFLSLPAYSTLVDRKLTLELGNLYFWIFFIGFILFTGVLAGSYPAFYLSSFQPIKVLKGKLAVLLGTVNPRKLLVVSQFVIAIVLIISTLGIRKQIQYGQDRALGFNKERLLYIYEQGDIAAKSELIKNELIAKGIASSVTRSMSPITQRWSNSNGMHWEGKAENNTVIINRTTADDKIVETAGLTLIAGRDFDLKTYPTDSSGIIINATAAKLMGFKDPLGKIIYDNDREWHVVGVIKDFIQESPFDPINPLMIEGAHGNMNVTHIKIKESMPTQEALKGMEAIYKTFNPDYPFDYQFVDEEYAMKFDESVKIGQLASLFASLTILISCLGLVGLAAFMAENRTKEIGIRKVLGASIFNLTKLLSMEFMVLVLIACGIAFPFAYWAMDSFLTKYTYRINIGFDIFLIAGFSALLITLLSVSYQSLKAACTNPVNSLRDE